MNHHFHDKSRFKNYKKYKMQNLIEIIPKGYTIITRSYIEEDIPSYFNYVSPSEDLLPNVTGPAVQGVGGSGSGVEMLVITGADTPDGPEVVEIQIVKAGSGYQPGDVITFTFTSGITSSQYVVEVTIPLTGVDETPFLHDSNNYRVQQPKNSTIDASLITGISFADFNELSEGFPYFTLLTNLQSAGDDKFMAYRFLITGLDLSTSQGIKRANRSILQTTEALRDAWQSPNSKPILLNDYISDSSFGIGNVFLVEV